MSKAGSKILPFPLNLAMRRSEQTGMTQRSFPARWLALLLMGSVGAAWALNPSLEEGGVSPTLAPGSRVVIEGEAQVVSQLMGSLLGDVSLAADDGKIMAGAGASRRIVLESQITPDTSPSSLREKAEFLRSVEDLEASYLADGQYPALPAGKGGTAASVSYRTDGEDFTLSSGNRRYTAAEGLTYGAPPAKQPALAVKGFLSAKSSGWGPWKSEAVSLEKKKGVEDVSSLAFLEKLPVAPRWSARMFFPVDRQTSGYLFQKPRGASAYASGELTYDGLSGSFSLKLFRAAGVESRALSSALLDAELANHAGVATALVGDAALMADLGLLSKAAKGDEVVAVTTSAVMPCSTTTALDGLRLASLERHKENLVSGKFAGKADEETKASLVGRLQVADKLGQLHQLKIRAGRGVNYDWVVGQVCPLQEDVRSAGFVDSEAATYGEDGTASSKNPIVKAGS